MTEAEKKDLADKMGWTGEDRTRAFELIDSVAFYERLAATWDQLLKDAEIALAKNLQKAAQKRAQLEQLCNDKGDPFR